jgi:hypothetical protein
MASGSPSFEQIRKSIGAITQHIEARTAQADMYFKAKLGEIQDAVTQVQAAVRDRIEVLRRAKGANAV